MNKATICLAIQSKKDQNNKHLGQSWQQNDPTARQSSSNNNKTYRQYGIIELYDYIILKDNPSFHNDLTPIVSYLW